MDEEAMASHGWSSLPADLVNRVADCLLATNDLDYYTDLRGVCQHWRSVTADPRSNQHDPRFRPSRWVMLDEQKAAAAAAANTVDDGTLLFVNTATGRFLRMTLCVPGHAFVTSTTGGLIVLAARDPPHALSVLNPFTGTLIRFAAELPVEPLPSLRLTADVLGPSPTLVLVSVGRSWVYSAEPQSESFSVDKSHRDCPASWLSHNFAAAAVNRESSRSQLRSDDYDEAGRHCYSMVVASGEDMLLGVLKRHDDIDVFKIDAAGNVMERVTSIGRRALFLGVRCLVVDTDCFPATVVEPNCAYFQLTHRYDGLGYIYKFGIGTEEEPELVSGAMDDNDEGDYSPFTMGPFTFTQLLCNYTMDIPGLLLTWELEGCCNYVDIDGYTDWNWYYKK